jgi:hypothetical protein
MTSTPPIFVLDRKRYLRPRSAGREACATYGAHDGITYA